MARGRCRGEARRAHRAGRGIRRRRARAAHLLALSPKPGPARHLHLLGQLLAEFYAAKLREEKLRETSYLQAVHETGARTTHDIKNLLQSLNVLCSVAAGENA